MTARLWPKRPLIQILLIFLASRGLVFATFFAIDAYHGKSYESVEQRLTHYVHNWDSGFYRVIATHGYAVGEHDMKHGTTRYAFYPLMPLLARGVSEMSGLNVSLAGSLVSHVCFFGALYLFRIYALQRSDETIARRALLLLAFCPHGFVFSAFYTESLFLFLALAAIVSFDKQHFVGSSIASALITSVRSNGLFVVVYFGYKAAEDAWSRIRQGQSSRAIIESVSRLVIPAAMAPLGLLAFWWFSYANTGDAFAQTHSAHYGWSVDIGMPFRILNTYWGTNAKNNFWIGSGLFFLAANVYLFRHKLYADAIFACANMLLFFSNSLPNSMLRYSIVVFPAYLGLALLTRRSRIAYGIILALFLGTHIFLCYAWLGTQHISI